MKSVFNFITTAAVILLALAGPARATEPAPAPPAPVEQVAACVAYVVADYPGAVADGKIIAQDEYDEQRGILGKAKELAAALPEPRPGARARLDAALGVVLAAFEDKHGERELLEKGRAVQRLLREEWNLVLTPAGAASRERARTLFSQACARCHGEDGRAGTEEAKKLNPPPVSFHEEARMRTISAELAFQALTFGVPGTGMAAFDSLPVADRWSLAFYALSLRHAGADTKRGEAVIAARAPGFSSSVSRLAPQTDEDLRALLPGAPADELAAALAFWRAEAPFRADPGGRFAVARARLAELATAADDHDRARALAVAAYLEGVEPHEAALKAKDPALSSRLEKTFLDLRTAIDGGLGGEALRREVARTVLVVDSVEEHARGGKSVPFLAAFAIALREGFEISLLVAALLAFLRKAGREEDARWVHLGWVAAVPTGAIAWFAIGAALSGARRELTEGVLTLVAAAMLLFVSHFVLGRLESRKWLKFLERRTIAAGGKAGGVGAALFSVAFVAAFREAIEIVLFFKALLLDSTSGPWPIVGGAAAGVALLVVAVTILGQLGRRLNPRPLMLVSSVVLTVLAISLVGQGVRALQEGGFVPLSVLRALPNVPVLGLYATIQGLVAQAVVLVLVIVPVLLEKKAAPPKAPA